LVEKWRIYGAFITSANFGSYDWASDEAITIEMEITYDWAVLEY